LLRDPAIKVAFVSILITIIIISARAIAFLISNSLVILADTLHSFFDIVAGLIAIFALKTAKKPPDEEHTYGHMKAENLGSLYESTLIFIVCIFIIYESISRLLNLAENIVFYDPIIILILIFTLFADIWRGFALRRASRKFASLVLEGDSLHYLSDAAVTFSAIIVISIGYFFFSGYNLILLDSLAGLFIASYFVYTGSRLAKRSIDDLLDRAPPGVIEKVKDVIKELNCLPTRVRARRAGNKIFIDCIVFTPQNITPSQAHEISEEIERRIRSRLNYKEIDIVLYMEPMLQKKEEIIRKNIQRIIKDMGISAHNLIVEENEGKFDVRMHAEIPAKMDLNEAHNKISALEKRIKEEISEVKNVIIHIEPYRELHVDIKDAIKKVLQQNPEIARNIKMRTVMMSKIENRIYIDLVCDFAKSMSVEDVHKITASFESHLREILGDDIIVTIHQEPI